MTVGATTNAADRRPRASKFDGVVAAGVSAMYRSVFIVPPK